MSEHTKLPWEIIWQTSDSFTIGIRNTQIVVAQVAIERDINSHYGPTRDEAQANAELIVRACNTFGDIEEGISLIVRKDHYYAMEAQNEKLVEIVGAFVRGHEKGAAMPLTWLLKEAKAEIAAAKPEQKSGSTL